MNEPQPSADPAPEGPVGEPEPAGRRRRTVMLVGAAMVVVLVAGGVGLAAYLGAQDADAEATGDASSTAHQSAASHETATPHESAEPSAPSAAEWPFTAADVYSGPRWEYQLAAENGPPVSGQLELIDTYDHADCAAAALTDQVRAALGGCTHRIEAAYQGTATGIMVLSEQVLVFAEPDDAAAFYEQFGNEYAGDLLQFQDPTGIAAATGPASGYTISRTGGAGRFIVLTTLYSRSDDEVMNQRGRDDMAARNQETTRFVNTWNG